MEVKVGPNSVEDSTLLYKLQRKIKVFNTVHPLANRGYNLVSCTSKYGLVFIASPSKTLSVYYLKEIIDKECDPKCLSIQLPILATHIAVNCNQEWLAVVGNQMLIIYKCQDFQNQTGGPAASLKCDVAPNTFVSALQWNPCIPDTIGIVFLDGTLIIYQISTMQVKKIKSNAKCLCWSPKGKQLVVGNGDGTLSQYKPDLTPTKVVPAPNLFEGNSVEVLAIFWISTYQFAVTYKNATDNSRPAITIVNTPKNGQIACTNYDDICYSMGSNRPWYFYLQGIAQWNIILSSSSNSMEIATLASADGSNWLQWCQPDEARPELPLTHKQETYPVGMCIDTCAIHQLPWGEGDTLPAMPLLHVLSHTGILSVFNIVNLNKSSAQVCSAPVPMMLPAGLLTSDIPDDAPQQLAAATPPQPKPQPYQQEPYQQQVQPYQYQQQLYQQQPYRAQSPTQPQPIYPQSVQPQAFQPQPVQSQPSQIPQVPQSRQIPPEVQKAPPALAHVTPAPQAKNVTKANPPPVQKIETPAAPSIPKASSLPPLGTSSTLVQQKPTVVKPNVTQTSSGQKNVIQTNVGQTTAVQAPVLANPNALKAEQTKMNKAKVAEELKNMLIKEVNDFQMELYQFKKMTHEKLNKMQTDIQTSDVSFNLHSLDVDRIRKDCDIEELRLSVNRLKLELVRACAVVAEARSHAEARDQYEWSQEDPLTAKRIASVKKLAYYVQNQMDQARKAFEHRYNEMEIRNQRCKPGERMIRPMLEDIYQPLVKQQEILARQAAMLKSLRNTFDECTIQGPRFKSTSILRNTPFRNKDPLSKLTKNILNMSIEPETKPTQVLSSQKLDALRDMLSNHTPVKIKPVHIDLRKHVETMKMRYDKSLKEKGNIVEVKKEAPEQPAPVLQSVAAVQTPVPQVPVKFEVKPSLPKESPITVPTFAPMVTQKPVKNIENVARTLFAEEKKPEPIKVAPVFSQPQVNVPAVVEQKQIAPPSAKPNVLQSVAKSEVKPFMPSKDTENTSMAQKISSPTVNYSNTSPGIISTPQPSVFQNVAKSDVKPFALTKETDNTFMGQKICSPTPLSFSQPSAANTITALPKSDMTNMFPKFTNPSVPQFEKIESVNLKLDETNKGGSGVSWQELMNTTGFRPPANMATPPVFCSVSEVQKSTQGFVFGKTENKTIANPVEKDVKNVKENIPEVKKDVMQKEEIAKVIESNIVKPIDYSKIIIVDLKKNTSKSIDVTPSTVFSAANTTTSSSSKAPSVSQPQIIFGSATTPLATDSDKSKALEKPTSKPIPKATFISKTEIESTSAATTPSSPGTTPSPPGTTPSPPGTNSSTDSLKSSGSTATLENASTPTQSSAFVPVSQPTSDNTETVSLTTTSVFVPTTTSAQSSTFTVTTSASSIFASASPSGFGTPTTQSFIFGANTPKAQPTFGQATTTTSSVFGNTSPAKGLFSAAASNAFGSTATTAQSVFGTSAVTTQQSSVFGSQNQGSVFGASKQTTVFGSTSSPGSIFGSVTTQAQPTVFGSPGQSSQTSVFGSTTPVQGSVFGAQTTQSSSVFGTPTTSGQSSSPFGSGEGNLFAAASISTTSAQSQNTGGNIFGNSSSVFGGGSSTNVFGGKTAFGGSSPSAANIFGGAAAATFGQKPANDFWSGSGNASTGSAFGSSTFGQQPTTQASSIFGGSSGGSFSTPATGQPFGSPGPFSGGDSKSVFGTPQQQTGGFGGSPVFGGSPAFGGKPSFGSSGFGGFNKSPGSGFGAAPAFGSGATFGSPAFGSTSPGKVFGSATPSFGSPTQQSSPVFENLATQNSLTFGNLAQQSGPTQQAPPGFNTSPSFTGWRG